MADEPTENDRPWLQEPLGPTDWRVRVEVGEGVELSPEIRDALDTLLQELNTVDVEGFAVSCPDLSACKQYNCEPLGKCTVQWRRPCYWDEGCKIATFI
jgi:hypothetical protein